jgi:adenylylsulfate kinase
LFQRLDDEVQFVYLRADLETCLARNRERDDPIDERGVRVVYHEFDPPRADVTVETTDRSVAETVALVTEAVLSLLDG